jgi:hypothetical protein
MKLHLDLSALSVETFDTTTQGGDSPYTAFCGALESLRIPGCVINGYTDVCITPKCDPETEI